MFLSGVVDEKVRPATRCPVAVDDDDDDFNIIFLIILQAISILGSVKTLIYMSKMLNLFQAGYDCFSRSQTMEFSATWKIF